MNEDQKAQLRRIETLLYELKKSVEKGMARDDAIRDLIYILENIVRIIQ